MNTRTNQTVLDSKLITSVSTHARVGQVQVRCLYAGQDLARFIVVDSNDVLENSYQVRILAEARFSVKRNHLSFKSQELSCIDADVIKSRIYSAAMKDYGIDFHTH